MLLNRRYHAPADDGGVLFDPPLETVEQLFDLSVNSKAVFGESLADYRAAARREILDLCRAYLGQFNRSAPQLQCNRWIIAGHQPDFYHPGVWLKNFVLARLGRQFQAHTLNLIVDNDEVKTTAIRVPTTSGRVVSIALDHTVPGIAFEEWRIQDESLFQSVGERLREATRDWPWRPLGEKHWLKVREYSYCPRIADRLSAARRAQESAWDVANLELPVSWLCRTNAFTKFVSWIVDELDRFRECHNSVVHEYRAAHGIRSVNHPVSDLQPDETPFWTWTPAHPRRIRLMRANMTGAIIRPRALTLTMFVRLALGDLFIHGIGGAKYDQLTDAIAERFFGVKLSPYMVVSGTMRLPFDLRPAESIPDLNRQRRELMWNPHRVMPSAAPDLADKREALLRMPTETRQQRRERARLLRENLDQWQPIMSDHLTAIDHRIANAYHQHHINSVLKSREYPFIFFAEERLRNWFAKVTLA